MLGSVGGRSIYELGQDSDKFMRHVLRRNAGKV